mgnify:CR=1 FL=1
MKPKLFIYENNIDLFFTYYIIWVSQILILTLHKQIEVIINSNPQITRHNEKAYTFGDLYLLSSPHSYAGAILAFILFYGR